MQLLTEPALAGHFRGLGFPLPELYIQPKDHHGTSGAGSTIKAMGGGSTVNMSGFRLYFSMFFPEKEIKIHLGRLTWNLQITHEMKGK